MAKVRFLALLAFVVALCFGQLALAQTPYPPGLRFVPHTQANSLPGGEYGIWGAFADTPFPYGFGPAGDWWPCFGSATTVGGIGPGDPNCSSILSGGIVFGVPHILWPLASAGSVVGCDASAAQSTYTPCGQEENVWEDTTGDLTDDLLTTLTATQLQYGRVVYIYDSGTQDNGSWSSLGVTPANVPFDAVFFQDLNFGTLGVPAGPNNGNCYGNVNYPNPVLPGYFSIADNKTCVNPIAGPVFFTATAQLATPIWETRHGVTTVRYQVNYSLTQTWSIYLQ